MMMMNESCFVLDRHAELDFKHASSWKQQSTGRQVTFPRNIILTLGRSVFALTSKCCVHSREEASTIFLMSLFDPAGDRTHDLPHSRRACKPLHHRGGVSSCKFLHKWRWWFTCEVMDNHFAEDCFVDKRFLSVDIILSSLTSKTFGMP